MAYHYGDGKNKNGYQHDRKDINLARRLAAQNPHAGAGEILSIEGREYRSLGRSRRPGKSGEDEWNTPRFERYFSKADTNRDNQLKNMRAELDALKKQKAKPAGPPKPKPKGDQQIDPVKDSPEISAARKIVDDFQAGQKNKESPWAQAQADVSDSSTFGNFNPGGQTSSDEPQKNPQEFADKYKLNLIQSGATTQNNTDFTSRGESVLSSSDILKRDQQLYGNYM